MLLPRSHFPRLGMDGDHGVRSFFLSGGPSVTNWSQNPLLATCSVEGLGLVGVRGGLRVWKLGPQAFRSHVLNLDPPPSPCSSSYLPCGPLHPWTPPPIACSFLFGSSPRMLHWVDGRLWWALLWR